MKCSELRVVLMRWRLELSRSGERLKELNASQRFSHVGHVSWKMDREKMFLNGVDAFII